jgi:hypothetical protein
MKHSDFPAGQDSGVLFTLELREALRGFARDQRHDQLAGE